MILDCITKIRCFNFNHLRITNRWILAPNSFVAHVLVDIKIVDHFGKSMIHNVFRRSYIER